AEQLVHYSFLPWYRTGLASAVDKDAPKRGQLDITMTAQVGGASVALPPRTVDLIGPGDIIGIDSRAIVRLEPRPYSNGYEPNYLAAIEFFDEDFVWRYSPRAPNPTGKGRLHPWISLIVLEEGEFTTKTQGHGLPPVVSIPNSAVLPPVEEAYTWVHTHLN